MSEQKFVTGVIIGAALGGLVTLFNKDTRNYVCTKLKTGKAKTNYYIKRPSEAVQDIRQFYNNLAHDLSRNTDKVLRTLSQVQETLDKVSERTGENSSLTKRSPSNDNELIHTSTYN